jgi:uncharacterized protein (TIGR00297 family)
MKLNWQSKLVLLAVLPFAGAETVLLAHMWAVSDWPAAVGTLGLSLLFGLAVLQLRAATPAGAFTGTAIAICLCFSTMTFSPGKAVPYAPWRSALIPLLALFALTFLATRLGREHKERMGTAERRQGRNAAQVAANLGVAAIACSDPAQAWLSGTGWFSPALFFAPGLAALAEAAADTVSSELGQALGGRPRMLTTGRSVEPGTDGALSFVGTLGGIAAAAIVAAVGCWVLSGGWALFWIGSTGGVFGLFFDSLLGATLEERGWLNNDAVNFLSTAGAAAFALLAMAVTAHFGAR